MPRLLIAAIGAVMLMLFLGPRVIRWLRDHEVGQFIRPRGEIPEGHAEKQGTPTMGGLLILFAMTVPFLILSNHSTASMLVLFTTLACGAIGFVDDWMYAPYSVTLSTSSFAPLIVPPERGFVQM